MIVTFLLVRTILACNSDPYPVSKTVYVDQQRDSSGSGTECTPFNSLNSALTLLIQSGGTVQLLSSVNLPATASVSEVRILGSHHRISLDGLFNVAGNLTIEESQIAPGVAESGFRSPVVEVVGTVELHRGTYANNGGTVVVATDATVYIQDSEFVGNSGPIASVLRYKCSAKKPDSSLPSIRLERITVSQEKRGASVSVECVWDPPSIIFGLVEISGKFLTLNSATAVVVNSTSLEVVFTDVVVSQSSFALRVTQSRAPITVANCSFADIWTSAIFIEGFSPLITLITLSNISCTACVQTASIPIPSAVCHLSDIVVSKGGGIGATLQANCAEITTRNLYVDQIVGPAINFTVSSVGTYAETVVKDCFVEGSLLSYFGEVNCDGMKIRNVNASYDVVYFEGYSMSTLTNFLIDNCTAGIAIIELSGQLSSKISKGRIANSYAAVDGIFYEGPSTVLHEFDEIEIVDTSAYPFIWYASIDGKARTRLSNSHIHANDSNLDILGLSYFDFNVTNLEVSGQFEMLYIDNYVNPILMDHIYMHDAVCSCISYATVTTIYLEDSVFRNVTVTDIWSHIQSTVFYRNVTFIDCQGTLFKLWLSKWTLFNMTFANCSTTSGNSLIYMDESILDIQYTEFANFTGKSAGALLYLDKNSTATLRITAFRSLRMLTNNGYFYLYKAKFTIEDSSVRDFNSSIFDATMGSIATRNCDVSDGYSEIDINGGYIRCENCASIVVENSRFSRVSASRGGVVSAKFSNTAFFPSKNEYGRHVVSINSTFEDCTAREDGGVMHLSDSSAWIRNSTFRRNKASNGGSLQLLCDYSSTGYFCNYTLTDVLFQDNFARVNGGGYSFRLIEPFTAHITDINNTAAYGNLKAAYPVSLRRIGANSERIDVESGVTVHSNLTLALYDMYGQLVVTDNANAATVATLTSSSTLSGITRVFPISGLYNFDSFILLDHPGSTVQLLFQSEAIDYTHVNPNSNITAIPLSLTAFIRLCVAGEILVGVECVECASGSYNFNAMEAGSCRKCLGGMQCLGGANVVIQPGYWRPQKLSDALFKCPLEGACLNTADSECQVGYQGRLCTVCAPEFFRTGTFRCATCGSAASTIAKAVGVILAFILLLVYITYGAFSTAERARSPGGPLTRILLNYIQTFALITNFDLEWPYQILNFTEGVSVTGSGPVNAFSSSCIGIDFGVREVYVKLVLVTVLPIVLILLALFVWVAVAAAKRSMRYIRDYFVCTLIVIVMAMHPNVLHSVFQLMSCRSMEDNSSWLIADFREECWRGDHAKYIVRLALPAFLVWVVAAPITVLVVLMKSRKFKEKKSVKVRYSFLSAGYRESYFYWEFVMLARKTCFLILQSTLSSSATNVQVFSTLMLLSFFYELHMKATPFLVSLLNAAEAIAILSIVLNTITGLLLTYSKSKNLVWETFVVVLYVFSTAIFFGFWLFSVILTLKDKFRERLQSVWLAFNRFRGSQRNQIIAKNEETESRIHQL